MIATEISSARVGADGDTCDQCGGRIAPHADVVLFTTNERDTPAKMTCGPACLKALLAARKAASCSA
jgi:hypothetical protein